MNTRISLIYTCICIILISAVNSADNECLKTLGVNNFCVKCHEEKHYFAKPLKTECSCENYYVEKEDSNRNKICVSEGCVNYTDDGKCTECASDYKLVDTKCVKKCEGAKGIKNGECFDCPNGANICTIWNNRIYITDCKYGYGADEERTVCKKCKDGCRSCLFFGNTEICQACTIVDVEFNNYKYYRTINTDDYSGYTLECPKLNSEKFLVATSLLVLLFLFLMIFE